MWVRAEAAALAPWCARSGGGTSSGPNSDLLPRDRCASRTGQFEFPSSAVRSVLLLTGSRLTRRVGEGIGLTD